MIIRSKTPGGRKICYRRSIVRQGRRNTNAGTKMSAKTNSGFRLHTLFDSIRAGRKIAASSQQPSDSKNAVTLKNDLG